MTLAARPSALALSSEASTALPAWPWLLAVLAAAALGGGAWLVRRFVGARDPVLQALHAKDPIRAARLAAVGGPSQNAEQAVVRAVAYMQAGELAMAERELRAYSLPAADLKFMTACLRARQGRDTEARRLLAESIALQPAYATEVQLNADLSRLMVAPHRVEGYT
jgi:hypothetical protein